LEDNAPVIVPELHPTPIREPTRNAVFGSLSTLADAQGFLPIISKDKSRNALLFAMTTNALFSPLPVTPRLVRRI
jgi:hypothetical protein